MTLSRRQLVPASSLENDDVRFGVRDTLWVQPAPAYPWSSTDCTTVSKGGETMSDRDALAACLATWPTGVRPKIHWSTPRTEWLVEEQGADQAPKVTPAPGGCITPITSTPSSSSTFSATRRGLLAFDVMLEVRAKDLALIQLRRDLERYAPDLAGKLEPPNIS